MVAGHEPNVLGGLRARHAAPQGRSHRLRSVFRTEVDRSRAEVEVTRQDTTARNAMAGDGDLDAAAAQACRFRPLPEALRPASSTGYGSVELLGPLTSGRSARHRRPRQPQATSADAPAQRAGVLEACTWLHPDSTSQIETSPPIRATDTGSELN